MRRLLISGLVFGLACTSTTYEEEAPPAPGAGGAGGAQAGAGGTGGGAAARRPALRIMSPGAGSTVEVAADNVVPIAFAVTDFTLKMPGTCPEGDRWCGHVHLKVDGDACNNTAAGRAYNAAGFASPIAANLGYCPAVTGAHRIELELHRDDHSPVTDASTEKVTASMSFTAMQQQVTPPPPPPAPPSIAISSPAEGGQVTMAEGKVPIAFSVAGFTLKPPGMCTEADAPCGHVHLKVDGMACNNVAGGKPYNAAGAASPIQADLSLCPAAAGTHTAVLELRNDDHSAHMHEGASVTATVRFTAREY